MDPTAMDTDTLRTYVSYALFAGCLILGGAALLGLVSPHAVRRHTRPGAFFGYGFLSFVCFMGLGFVAPPVATDEGARPDSSPTLFDPALAGEGRGPAAAKPEEPDAVMQVDARSVAVSSSRTRWDTPMVIAQLPPGTEMVLLQREFVGQVERCEVRTTSEPRVRGWVHCASLRGIGGS